MHKNAPNPVAKHVATQVMEGMEEFFITKFCAKLYLPVLQFLLLDSRSLPPFSAITSILPSHNLMHFRGERNRWLVEVVNIFFSPDDNIRDIIGMRLS